MHQDAVEDFLQSFASVMLSTGAVKRSDGVTPESLDLALTAYINNVIDARVKIGL
jgi:hypothetical protein